MTRSLYPRFYVVLINFPNLDGSLAPLSPSQRSLLSSGGRHGRCDAILPEEDHNVVGGRKQFWNEHKSLKYLRP